jgi:hypothetical protein
MAKVMQPMVSRYEVSGTAAELPRASSTQREIRGKRVVIWPVAGLIAVAAVVGVLMLVMAWPALIQPLDDLSSIAAATSDAAPTDSVPK